MDEASRGASSGLVKVFIGGRDIEEKKSWHPSWWATPDYGWKPWDYEDFSVHESIESDGMIVTVALPFAFQLRDGNTVDYLGIMRNCETKPKVEVTITYLDGKRMTYGFSREQTEDYVFLFDRSYTLAKELGLEILLDDPGTIKDRETFNRLVADLEADLRGLLRTGGELDLRNYLNDY